MLKKISLLLGKEVFKMDTFFMVHYTLIYLNGYIFMAHFKKCIHLNKLDKWNNEIIITGFEMHAKF